MASLWSAQRILFFPMIPWPFDRHFWKCRCSVELLKHEICFTIPDLTTGCFAVHDQVIHFAFVPVFQSNIRLEHPYQGKLKSLPNWDYQCSKWGQVSQIASLTLLGFLFKQKNEGAGCYGKRHVVKNRSTTRQVILKLLYYSWFLFNIPLPSQW